MIYKLLFLNFLFVSNSIAAPAGGLLGGLFGEVNNVGKALLQPLTLGNKITTKTTTTTTSKKPIIEALSHIDKISLVNANEAVNKNTIDAVKIPKEPIKIDTAVSNLKPINNKTTDNSTLHHTTADKALVKSDNLTTNAESKENEVDSNLKVDEKIPTSTEKIITTIIKPKEEAKSGNLIVEGSSKEKSITTTIKTLEEIEINNENVLHKEDSNVQKKTTNLTKNSETSTITPTAVSGDLNLDAKIEKLQIVNQPSQEQQTESPSSNDKLKTKEKIAEENIINSTSNNVKNEETLLIEKITELKNDTSQVFENRKIDDLNLVLESSEVKKSKLNSNEIFEALDKVNQTIEENLTNRNSERNKKESNEDSLTTVFKTLKLENLVGNINTTEVGIDKNKLFLPITTVKDSTEEKVDTKITPDLKLVVLEPVTEKPVSKLPTIVNIASKIIESNLAPTLSYEKRGISVQAVQELLRKLPTQEEGSISVVFLQESPEQDAITLQKLLNNISVNLTSNCQITYEEIEVPLSLLQKSLSLVPQSKNDAKITLVVRSDKTREQKLMRTSPPIEVQSPIYEDLPVTELPEPVLESFNEKYFPHFSNTIDTTKDVLKKMYYPSEKLSMDELIEQMALILMKTYSIMD